MIKRKIKLRHTTYDIQHTNKGAALLVVLFVIMAITILALGFMSRSDVELACGENMVLRTQMDYLAESGLEHARGLILNPQDVASEYWTGATAQQLEASSADYYDVSVVRDDSDPTDHCNYIIDCNSYRMKAGQEVGRSSLSAQLRLDPCVALWTGKNTTLASTVAVYGDVYCDGKLINKGLVKGDVFVKELGGSGSITGQRKATADLSLGWPRVTVADFTSRYSTVTISSGTLSGQTLGPDNPPRVYYRNGNLTLAGNVRINGMLVVDGDLKVQGNINVLVAARNLPALLVTSDLVVEKDAELEIDGLAVVGDKMKISAGAAGFNVLGGLFVEKGLSEQDDFTETTVDSSGNGHTGMLHNGPTWRPSGGWTGGALEFDGRDDRVEDPYADSYLNGLSAITLSLWVKSDVTYEDRDILFTRNPTGIDAELGLRYDRDGARGGAIRCIKASIRATSGYTQVESTSDVQTTAWQHLALVWQSGQTAPSLKLYINGQLNPLTYDGMTVFGTVTGVQKLMLGRGTKDKYWDGLIDDVRIYNRALQPSEIYPPKDGLDGLILHWKLDEKGCNVTITAAPEKTAILHWSEQGVEQKWGQAAGAFFKSIRRR